MSITYLVTALLLGQAAPPLVVEDPPPPDFETHVDYVQWYKDQVKLVDADNAYQEYQAFLAPGRQPQVPDRARGQLSELVESPRTWRSHEFPELANWLRRIDPQLEIYIAGTKHKFFVQPVTDNHKFLCELIYALMRPSRLLSKAMIVRAWQIDGEFNGGRFVDHMKHIHRHANLFAQSLTLIEQIVAIRIKSLAYQSTIRTVEAELLTEADLKAMLSFLREEDLQPAGRGLTRSLYTERALTYEALQVACTEDGRLQRRFSRSDILKTHDLIKQMGEGGLAPEDKIEALLSEDPEHLSQQVQGYFTSIMTMCSRTLPTNADALAKSAHRPLVESSVFLGIFLGDLANALSQTIRAETQRRGTQVILALAIYRKQNGHWPKSLRESALNLKRTVRWDPRTRKDLLYKVDGQQFTLYSVGKDGRDDGGKTIGDKYEDREGEDLVLWPTRK
jgi:hypothetical protein